MSGKYVTETLHPDERGLARAAQLLRDGGLVAVPTETVYGLAARADNDEAVARIYEAKGRPSSNPLIVHVSSVREAREIAHFTAEADALAASHWPGPLTLVLSALPMTRLSPAVTAGLDTIALRVPAHPVMRGLLEKVDFPLAAPSANKSGFISPTTADHVLSSLDERIDAVLDAGPCESGVESTIVAVRSNGSCDVLRPGPLSLGPTRSIDQVEAPGQFASHYAPGKPVRLNVTKVAPDEFFIGFGSIPGDSTLSATGDLVEAAHRLYACLHEGARSKKPRIAVAPIPDVGLGVAINDRLRRAAAPVN